MDKKIRILAVAGATASGKSSLALELARLYGGEIVSCDSMQVYKRMDIGTAKPTAEERAAIPHHMIDIAEPTENYSCADYIKAAARAIEDISGRGKLPIICGGTGLYLDALLRGSDFSEDSTPDEAVRRELFEFAETHGKDALFAELQRIDPESAAAIHPNNVKRVIRAIEIYRTSGVTKSELDRRSLESPSKYDAAVIALRYNDRELLRRRIDARVDAMIAMGLEAETRALMSEGVFEKNTTAAQAIGYKEFLGYFRGESTFEECAELLKVATRKYAKRQMTWFGGKKYVEWIDADTDMGVKSFKEIVNSASKLFFGD
ncbi:MAG: tRNA (adenosine(37)-N6)-dimethylallyltransferase MiaA [Clostridia bacterium]|nr:tRNA (adenosine(37)-N6)-dimethylallyltransferase MiaA [Clostridia bacterium]